MMTKLITWFIELQNRFNESRLFKILMIYVLNRVNDLTSWHWLSFKFFKIAWEFRLTLKWAKKMICNDALTLQEKNLLLKMLFNREVTMIWDFSEMRKIKDIISFLQQIWMISHDAW